MYYLDYRQMQQPPQQFGPNVPSQFFPSFPFPGGRLEQRVDQLERQVARQNAEINQLNREIQNLERRVRRLEQRLPF